MLAITSQHRLSLALSPIDFRKGIDSLAACCRQHLSGDPFSGEIFAFRNKQGTAVKLLSYDGNGFWLCHKRFSSGKLKWWPKTTEQATSLNAVELLVILQQGQPKVAGVPEPWRPLTGQST